jgi:hypothetical protein
MKSEANRCFIARYGAAARSTGEHNGDTASFCMRRATQIPLYYLKGSRAGREVITTRLTSSRVLVTQAIDY